MSHFVPEDNDASTITVQALHREAMVQLEKSIEHHRQAALFHEAGDSKQAAMHGTIAFDCAAHAVEISGRAMLVQPQVRRPPKKPRTHSWVSSVIGVAKKMWRAGSST